MRSGAGDAFSRRRWPLPTMLSSVFISLLAFVSSLVKGVLRSFQWRQELWFVVFTAVLRRRLLFGGFSPTMSREGSLTTVVLVLERFREPFSLSHGQATPSTFHTVDFVLALQLLMDSSFSSPLSVLSSFPVCPLLNRGSAYLHRPSPSPSGFDGNPAYLKNLSPPASAIYLSSMTSRNFPAYAFAFELRSIRKWAWPNSFAEAYNQIIKILKARLSVQDVRYLAAGLNSLDNLKISHGFIGVYNLRLLQYHFFKKNLSSSSSNEESISPPYLPSMNGDVLLGSIPSFCFNSLTGLSPCVAVCTGPEGAIEITLVLFVGGGCPSTSLVTISQLSDFVMKVLQTHSSIVLNPLSFSYEDLSCLISFLIVVYCLFLR
ncbi:hypothetical protein Bca52824_021281 [Brassica carinata]|uniref:Uncharacterized protein n=1 Tax=Brassica carinata TaxID=52824 RepID=A0A8X8AZD0_BRACI|nr:hypothetical protein Bca52824_021281 [Brassica carinata]